MGNNLERFKCEACCGKRDVNRYHDTGERVQPKDAQGNPIVKQVLTQEKALKNFNRKGDDVKKISEAELKKLNVFQ